MRVRVRWCMSCACVFMDVCVPARQPFSALMEAAGCGGGSPRNWCTRSVTDTLRSHTVSPPALGLAVDDDEFVVVERRPKSDLGLPSPSLSESPAPAVCRPARRMGGPPPPPPMGPPLPGGEVAAEEAEESGAEDFTTARLRREEPLRRVPVLD